MQCMITLGIVASAAIAVSGPRADDVGAQSHAEDTARAAGAAALPGGPPPCDPSCGDADGDGDVDISDLNATLFNFDTVVVPGTDGDVNCDGAVNLDDVNVVLASWSQACGEPGLAQIVVDKLQASQANWAFPILETSALVEVEITAGNQLAVLDQIMSDTDYPSLFNTNPGFLQVGKLVEDPGITAQQMVDFIEGLDAIIGPGDTLVRVSWLSPDAGRFQTYAVVRGSEVVFETFCELIPDVWPPFIDPDSTDCEPTTAPGIVEIFSQWPALGMNRTYSNGFGVAVANFACRVWADCAGITVVGCTAANVSTPRAIFWSATGTSTVMPVGNCCVATCNFGMASGFMNVVVAPNGIDINITGVYGSATVFSSTATACCDACDSPE